MDMTERGIFDLKVEHRQSNASKDQLRSAKEFGQSQTP